MGLRLFPLVERRIMKKLIFTLLLAPLIAFAVLPDATKYALDHSSGPALKYGLGTQLSNTRNLAVGKYSYAVQGGAVGNISLLNDLNAGNVASNYTTIPDNAIIQNAWVDVLTQPTSSSAASIKVELVNDGDILGSTAKASFTGMLQGIPDAATIGDWIKLSADKVLKIEVVTTALTAGKFNVYIEYILGD